LLALGIVSSFSCAEILGITSADVLEGGVDGDATVSDVAIERALVQCGDVLCDACCAPALICDPQMFMCFDASLLHCDKSAGCNPGEVCCYDEGSGVNSFGPHTSNCSLSCTDGSIMCDPLVDSSCAGGETCQLVDAGNIVGYHVCK
jgi:hypothetical protein